MRQAVPIDTHRVSPGRSRQRFANLLPESIDFHTFGRPQNTTPIALGPEFPETHRLNGYLDLTRNSISRQELENRRKGAGKADPIDAQLPESGCRYAEREGTPSVRQRSGLRSAVQIKEGHHGALDSFTSSPLYRRASYNLRAKG